RRKIPRSLVFKIRLCWQAGGWQLIENDKQVGAVILQRVRQKRWCTTSGRCRLNLNRAERGDAESVFLGERRMGKSEGLGLGAKSLGNEVAFDGGLADLAGVGIVDADADLNAADGAGIGRRGFALCDVVDAADIDKSGRWLVRIRDWIVYAVGAFV